MPKNLLSICVNFTLATQQFFFEESNRSKPNFSVLRLSLRDSFNRIPNPRANVKSFFVPIRHLFLVSPHKTNYKSRNRQSCADR